MKDFYRILGVAQDATQAEIRTAYRHRARAVHPDCSEEDGRLFRELQEAYDILGDPARRRNYDRQRRPGRARGEGFRPATSPYPDSDKSSVLAALRRHFGRQPAAPPRQRWGGQQGLNLRVRISRQEARHGGRLRFRLAAPQVCGHCGGRGAAGFFVCSACRGTGVVQEVVPVEIKFPPGMRDGQRAQVSLAPLGLEQVTLSLTFAIMA